MIQSWKIFRENIDAMGLLHHIFCLIIDLDDDPTDNHSDEKPSTEKMLINALKQPVSKLYVMLVQSVIPIFDSFNFCLQAEEPLIHVLYYSTLRLYRSLL